jgi:CheY-like chemotaxis protein
MGTRVIHAGDGDTALAMARREPNLIVLDIMLPGMDGWEVCRCCAANRTSGDHGMTARV